jgi:hypothetical protein
MGTVKTKTQPQRLNDASQTQKKGQETLFGRYKTYLTAQSRKNFAGGEGHHFIFQVKSKSKSGERAIPHAVTGWRLWLFRITAVAIIPAFLFSLLEITLRAADYGFHPDIAVKHKINNIPPLL